CRRGRRSRRRTPARSHLSPSYRHLESNRIRLRRRGTVEAERAAVLQQERDQRGPAGLVACAKAGAVVAMKELMERDVVAPVGVALDVLVVAEHRPTAVTIAQKDAGQSPGKPFGNFGERLLNPGAGRVLQRERLAVVAREGGN